MNKLLENYCDFVFFFGLKLRKELNFNEGLDLKVCCVK
jgi:hypothetical protein